MTTRLHSNPFAEHREEVLQVFDVKRFGAYFDRAIQKQAKTNAGQANDVGATAGSNAAQIGSVLIPGLERQATNPTGFSPVEKNRMLVAGAEGAGGAGAGATGAATLEKMRTRNPAGFSAALDEAARIKGRQMSSNALGVEGEDARLAQEKQARAQQMLQGLYGTDTAHQLQAMGLANEDLNTALQAGKSGWLQNTMGVIGTLSDAAKAAKPFFPG